MPARSVETLFLINCLCSFVKVQLTVFVWVYSWTFRSVPLICLSICSTMSLCLDYCPFKVSLEVSQCKYFNFVLLLQYCISYSGSFASHINFKISLLFFQNNLLEIGLLFKLRILLFELRYFYICSYSKSSSFLGDHQHFC